MVNTIIIPTPRVTRHTPDAFGPRFSPHYMVGFPFAYLNGRPSFARYATGRTIQEAKANLWRNMRNDHGQDLTCKVDDNHNAPHPLR